mmetsp:Transcript_2038/g.2325  ORF Transcript_2038/g.2325 Transcript_2038/m.2325 type:complete len:180 (+) Transcript_2038:105-644(+)
MIIVYCISGLSSIDESSDDSSTDYSTDLCHSTVCRRKLMMAKRSGMPSSFFLVFHGRDTLVGMNQEGITHDTLLWIERCRRNNNNSLVFSSLSDPFSGNSGETILPFQRLSTVPHTSSFTTTTLDHSCDVCHSNSHSHSQSPVIYIMLSYGMTHSFVHFYNSLSAPAAESSRSHIHHLS